MSEIELNFKGNFRAKSVPGILLPSKREKNKSKLQIDQAERKAAKAIKGGIIQSPSTKREIYVHLRYMERWAILWNFSKFILS